jgi:hypothetical protein
MNKAKARPAWRSGVVFAAAVIAVCFQVAGQHSLAQGQDPIGTLRPPASPAGFTVPATSDTGDFQLAWTVSASQRDRVSATEFSIQRRTKPGPGVTNSNWESVFGTTNSNLNSSPMTFQFREQTRPIFGTYEYRLRGCRDDKCTPYLYSSAVFVRALNYPLTVRPNFGFQNSGRFLSNNSTAASGLAFSGEQYFKSVAPDSKVRNALAPDVDLQGGISDAEKSNLGPRGTFSRWLAKQNQLMNNPEWVSLQYYNRSELGIGRGMYCAQRTEGMGTLVHAACYVVNCGDPKDRLGEQGEADIASRCIQEEDARSFFDKTREEFLDILLDNGVEQPEFALEGHIKNIRRQLPAAVVAMEYNRTNLDNPVQFYVFDYMFDHASSRIELDGVSSADYPGNCTTCHGGYVSKLPNGIIRLQGARFLPFDWVNLQFMNTAAKTAAVETVGKLNAIVRKIEEALGRGASTLARMTYDFSEDRPSAPLSWFGYLKASWSSETVNKPALYVSVVRPYCASCHVARDSVFLNSPDEFLTDYVAKRACGPSHDMPKAEVTESNFYNDNKARLLMRKAFNLSGIRCEL